MAPMRDLFSKPREDKQAPNEQGLELEVRDEVVLSATKRETQHIIQAIQHRFPNVDLVDLPEPLRQACADLLSLERPGNLEDLAKYYAQFVVANQIEHDHASIDQDTKNFYKSTAKRRGCDIFPDPKDVGYANQFDNYLESAISNLALARSKEQTAYLKFQDQVRTEVSRIQSLMQSSDELGTKLQETQMPNGSKTIKFLNHTLDNMLRAVKKEGVELYAKDALSILVLLQSSCQDPDLSYEIEDSIQKLKGCILNLKDHHLQLMHSVTDKRRELQLSTVLKVVAVAAGSALAHAGGMTLLEDMGIPQSNLVSHDHLATGATFSAKKGIDHGASRVEGAPDEAPEGARLLGDDLLQNLRSAKPEESWSDTFVNARKELEQNPQKTMITVGTAVLCTAIGLACPPAGAVLGSALGLGEAAKSFYYSQKALNYTEETAESRRICHEIEMQDFLTDYPVEHRTLFVTQYQERTEKLEKVSANKKALAMDPEAKDLIEEEGMTPLQDMSLRSSRGS